MQCPIASAEHGGVETVTTTACMPLLCIHRTNLRVPATSAVETAAMTAVTKVEIQLQAEIKKQGGVIASQKTALEKQQATLEKLAASDAVRCGRPCYPGEHVQQPCTAAKVRCMPLE